MSTSEHQTVELTSTSSTSVPTTSFPTASAGETLPAPPLPLLGSQSFATSASWTVNILLTIAKIIVFVSSRSKAVLASLADSIGAPSASLHLRAPSLCALARSLRAYAPSLSAPARSLCALAR